MMEPNFYTKVVKETADYGEFIIEPLPFSFGNSLGNALRRTLLSSLKGAAITQVKIAEAPHIFTAIKGVKESVLEIILNLKQLRFQIPSECSFKMKLSVKGPKKIYGQDIEGEIKIINKDLYIGEITDEKGKLDIEAIVEVGIGYLSTEDREKKEFGFTPVDASFSPVKQVNFRVEEVRVGRKTNSDRLIIEITTDGSIKPSDAMREAAGILSNYYQHILSGKDVAVTEEEKSEAEVEKEQTYKKLSEIIIDELDLPSRVINALLRENIETVAELIKVGKGKLTTYKGVGKKSVALIEEELKKLGVSLD